MSNPAPETTEPPAPQFRKTKQGKWAVMGPVETLQAALDGDGKVKVLKKSGDWSDFTVVSLGRPFDVEGVSMVYGYDDEGDPSAGGGGAAPAGGGQSSGGSSGSYGGGDPRGESRQPPPSTPAAPPRDDSEPLPEFQGGPEDEWQGEF